MVAAGRSTLTTHYYTPQNVPVSADRGRGRSFNRLPSHGRGPEDDVSADRGRGRSFNRPPRKSGWCKNVGTALRASLEFSGGRERVTMVEALQTLSPQALRATRAFPAPLDGTVTLAKPDRSRRPVVLSKTPAKRPTRLRSTLRCLSFLTATTHAVEECLL